ncbi:hypothetical protein RB598_000149 [Gaeumannomyces tritici]
MDLFDPLTPPAEAHRFAQTSAKLKTVRFRHPAYPDLVPYLLNLGGVDGVDFDLALTACCIVANTPWDDGYLATKEPGGGLLEADRPSDGLLRGTCYFFCIKGEPTTYRYPVLPSFHHWRFPHDNLPPLWRQLHMPGRSSEHSTKGPAAVKERDVTCRLSGYIDGTEAAHLVPAGEKNWFSANDMLRYCPPSASAINDEKNILLLRKDIHYLFDAKRFVFVPKRPAAPNPITLPTTSFPVEAHAHIHPTPDLDAQTKLAAYVLLPEVFPELVGLYHNRLPQPLCGIGVEFLFARFAWALFSDTHMPIFGSDFKIAVLLFDKTTGAFETRHMRGVDTKAHTRLFDRPQSKSASPRKRSLSTYSGSYRDEDDFWDETREPPRGRTLKRPWDTCSSPSRDAPGPGLSKCSVALASHPSPTTTVEGGISHNFSPPRKRMHLMGKET